MSACRNMTEGTGSPPTCLLPNLPLHGPGRPTSLCTGLGSPPLPRQGEGRVRAGAHSAPSGPRTTSEAGGWRAGSMSPALSLVLPPAAPWVAPGRPGWARACGRALTTRSLAAAPGRGRWAVGTGPGAFAGQAQCGARPGPRGLPWTSGFSGPPEETGGLGVQQVPLRPRPLRDGSNLSLKSPSMGAAGTRTPKPQRLKHTPPTRPWQTLLRTRSRFTRPRLPLPGVHPSTLPLLPNPSPAPGQGAALPPP